MILILLMNHSIFQNVFLSIAKKSLKNPVFCCKYQRKSKKKLLTFPYQLILTVKVPFPSIKFIPTE